MLFLLAGIYGVLAFLRPLPHVFFSGRIVYPLAAALSFAILMLYRIRRWTYWVLFGAAAAALYFYIRRHFTEVLFRIYRIGDDLTGVNGTEVYDITMTVVLLVVVLVFLFFLMEIVIRNHAVLYVLTTALLLAAPVANIRITFPELFMIAGFQIVFWSLQASFGSGMRRVSGRTGRIAFKSTLILLALAVPAAAGAWLIVSRNESKLENFVFSIEGNITGTYLGSANGESAEDKTDGHVSRGNNYKTGRTKLHITVNKQPTEMLYLCGFIGGNYDGEQFAEADEDKIAGKIADQFGWKQWERYIPSTIRSMYYAMNLGAEFENYRIGRYLTIRRMDKNQDMVYLPYYSAGAWNETTDQEDAYETYYFESKDVDIDWEGRADSEDPGYSGWTLAIRDAYTKEVQTAYTEVPESYLPRLSELVRQNPQEGLDNITAFIIYTLQNNASYTLTPGATPLNENTVEYFLFENHRGYCQQFAAAATLMFRMYGIPCRYVSGYRISPSAFHTDDGNLWEADATDLEMHAWPEVYTEDRGWVPIEVTPAGDTSGAVYPGFSGEGMQEFLAAHGFTETDEQEEKEDTVSESAPEETDSISEAVTESGRSTPEEAVQSESSVSGGTEPASGSGGGNSRLKQIFLQILKASAVIFCIALAAYALIRRIMRRIRNLTVRQWFSLMMERLHLAGLEGAYDGQERDFPEKLADFLNSIGKGGKNPDSAPAGDASAAEYISAEEVSETGSGENSKENSGRKGGPDGFAPESLREMQRIVLYAAYSRGGSVTAEERSFVRRTCRSIMKEADKKVSVFRKVRCRGRIVWKLIF